MTEEKREYPSVAIIILNWNGWKDTIECLESLYQINYPNYEVIVVDNGSDDESVQEIKRYSNGKIKPESDFFKYNLGNKPIDVTEVGEEEVDDNVLGGQKNEVSSDRRMVLVKNKKNYGFARGNNIGIKFALNKLDPKYVLLLNNDVVVDEDFLDFLVRYGEMDKDIGLVGPKIYFYNYEGRKDVISFAGETFSFTRGGKKPGSGEVDVGQVDSPREVNSLQGACILIKKKVIEKIGLLDSHFFIRREETDFCFRAKSKGFKLVYAPEAKIWHKEFSSAEQYSPLVIYFSNRNLFLLLKKNKSISDIFAFLLYFACFQFWRSTLHFLRKSPGSILYFLKGVWDGLTY